MKTIGKIVFCFIFSLEALSGNVKFETLTTTDGTTYKSVTVREVTPAGIRVFHSSGAAAIPFEDLPKEVQKQLGGFDSEKAKKYRKEQAEIQKKTNRVHAAQNRQLSKAKEEKKVKAAAEEKIKNAKKYWLIGKVQRIQTLGTQVLPASEKNGEWIASRYGIGETELAVRRLKSERNKLPGKLSSYLDKNGTFFGSVMGQKYIAQNWIKSPDDYEKYFSLEALFNNFQVVGSLGKYPLFNQEAPVIIHTDKALDAVDGEYVSFWVIPGEAHRTPDGRTLKAFSLFKGD